MSQSSERRNSGLDEDGVEQVRRGSFLPGALIFDQDLVRDFWNRSRLLVQIDRWPPLCLYILTIIFIAWNGLRLFLHQSFVAERHKSVLRNQLSIKFGGPSTIVMWRAIMHVNVIRHFFKF